LQNSAADSHFIANVIAAKVKEKTDYPVYEIAQDVNRIHRVQVSYWQAYRAKEKVINDLNGTAEEGYATLPQYCENFEKPIQVVFPSLKPLLTIQGVLLFSRQLFQMALMAMSDGNESKFKRLFISYEATINGFVHCRPLLGLDGTHLTSKYGGILLAATAPDARGQLFPVAFAIVSVENDDNWEWFLRNLHSIVKDNLPVSITATDDITFLSDRQKGLLEGVATWFPGSAHAYCLRHLVDNFSKRFKHKDLISLLWQAARATTEAEFHTACNAMRAINFQCVEWLLGTAHPMHWATVYFRGRRYGHLTSNIAESLNAWLLQARSLPIEGMLEAIREKLMGWFAERRDFATKHHDLRLVPEVHSYLCNKSSTNGRRFKL